MGYYLQIDTAEPEPLASNSGWGDFLDWAKSIPVEEAGELRHLCRYGWNGPEGIAAELSAALAKHPPRRQDVVTTARGLLELLKQAEGAEVISVTDGMGPE